MLRIVFIVCFFVSLPGLAQDARLSNKAEIYVVTCGPYQNELYSAFGHSAFRVSDPVVGLDWIYNYGVFDFNQPNFYLNFARGNLNYKLGVHEYAPFRDFYISHNRFIHEQQLNLTPQQKQKLFAFLEWNALPENQYYSYDYFYDNCATKIRDVVHHVFGDTVKFDDSYIQTDYTIRDLTDHYLKFQPWGDLGIDICLGLPMDKKASPYEYMFLPDYIESSFDRATIQDTISKPLIKTKIITYEARGEDIAFSVFQPMIVFGIVLLIGSVISYSDFKKRKLTRWLDTALFGSVGLIGWLLFLLWVATDHKAAAKNFNLLWALPSHAVVIFWLWKKDKKKWLSFYFKGTCVLIAGILMFRFALPQQINLSLIPLALLLMLRSWMIGRANGNIDLKGSAEANF